ncbi:eukaryotic translation initiation factor 5 [Elasticomyces elasticus]|uniref:Eukaryotic translation initiation factor 5 n=1 Tax=Exophiala sideris TaxID=1016849 RepID=A0ABR0JSQ6_9EURO|nr:eukaryotic translation initiation factor 5 [Elasticomyces elasticus]KAK5034700.1 eukaryotic translation initiation factor 5 [Exophiala sideris]KAK5039977.1 eukaryotic translation initiation factor 5 [Exophiala sideris]KAK5068356.1 eukaryotic translation initiation factor 5 [Exophiala sideris]KAK5187657.1 eukaryotic translation initiation factor 5 [Eurotiomycetes sp. CCFEE 6388]
MATINIRRDVTDPFYRYKMERLQSKIEGKGNGIKTVIPNLPSVAASLARPSAYLIKYFGFELGAQTNTNPKDDRWIINGAHDAGKLQDSLDGFISRFVLCKSCKNPETEVNIKDGRIILDCKACGQRTQVDIRHKLSGFILKNEPAKGGKKTKKDKMTRRERAKAESNENGSANGGSPHDSNSDKGDAEEGDYELEAGSDDEFTKQITESAKVIGTDTNGTKDEEWAIDTSAEAIAARAKELPSDLKRSLAFDEDEEGEENGTNVYDQLGTWIIDETKEKGSVTKVDDVDIYKKAKELGIESKYKTLTVLAQTIFDENIVKQIPARAGMLKTMIGDSEKHMKAFLGGTERFVGNDHTDLIPQVPAILMGYYQHDLLSEEVAKGWGQKASKKYVDIATSRKVRQAAEKFLQWLDEAESDEDDDDDEEE